MSYDEYFCRVADGALKGGGELRRDYSREALLLGFEDGVKPPEIVMDLAFDEGPAAIRARFILRRSPGGGDVFLRLAEDNITDRYVREFCRGADDFSESIDSDDVIANAGDQGVGDVQPQTQPHEEPSVSGTRKVS